ncbi:hypothetical protein P43SY_008348 [Pythium insidiosum]|uniref:Uncharacterized protein n=1 Tax=Pythium insidiosum TaxID=114742 RepID=A0AAD5QD72_PYTIN|nr:hypothetical protein P43SY_008348 [Pythium insidiosum]
MSAALFLMVLLLVAPGIALGLTYMCTASSTAVQVVGYILLAVSVLVFCGLVYWYQKKGGSERWHGFLERKAAEREERKAAEREQKELAGPNAV